MLTLLNKDTLVLRSGGGCLSVFGLPFLGAGVFLLLIGLKIVPLQNAQSLGLGEHVIMLLMGLIFAGAGTTLVFGRKRTTFDRARSQIEIVWSLLSTPIKTETRALGEFTRVTLGYRDGDSDHATVYPIKLENEKSGASLDVWSPTHFGKAREAAAQLAQFLAIPFEDRSTGKATITPAAENRDQPPATAPTESRTPIAKPAVMQSEIREANGETEIAIPMPFGRFLVFLSLLPVVFFFFIFSSVFKEMAQKGLAALRPENTGDKVGLVFFAFFALIAFVLPIVSTLRMALNKKRRSTVIRIGNGKLSFQNFMSRRRGARVFPLSDVLGVVFMGYEETRQAESTGSTAAPKANPFQPKSAFSVSRPNGPPPAFATHWANKLVLKTKDELIDIAHGIPRDEGLYLCQFIERKLRG